MKPKRVVWCSRMKAEENKVASASKVEECPYYDETQPSKKTVCFCGPTTAPCIGVPGTFTPDGHEEEK